MARKDALLRLHARLIARRDALRKALDGDLDSLRELSSLEVGDSVDAAVDTANDEISSQLAEIESRELEQIEHALKRIRAGVYGRCEFCDGKIAEPRINALPYTNSCIDCARQNERLGYRPGARIDSATRWDKIYEKAHDDDHDGAVDLSAIEMDAGDSGR